MTIHDLPLLNACLNGSSAACLLGGYLAIRNRNVARHRAFMTAALVLSVLFLTSYLIYHAQAGTTRFVGPPPVRTFYLAILGTHTVLAALVPFLVVLTVNHALRERIDRHRRIARWTLPIWLYVSVTGVFVYLMLYQWYPSR